MKINIENKKIEESQESLMAILLKKNDLTLPTTGDLVEGTVISIDKKAVFIKLHPYGTGIIYGREFMNVRNIIKNISVGDIIAAKVVDEENSDGYIELSLKEARQALVWSEAEKAIKDAYDAFKATQDSI